jgi:hypothetical protein
LKCKVKTRALSELSVSLSESEKVVFFFFLSVASFRHFVKYIYKFNVVWQNTPPPPALPCPARPFMGEKKTHQKRGKNHHNYHRLYTLSNFTTHNTKMIGKI